MSTNSPSTCSSTAQKTSPSSSTVMNWQLKPLDMENNSSRNTSFLTISTLTPCHPHSPPMACWSSKPPRSKQRRKVFALDPIFLYIYTHFLCLLNVQINQSALPVKSAPLGAPGCQISHLYANQLQLVLNLLLETCMMIITNNTVAI